MTRKKDENAKFNATQKQTQRELILMRYAQTHNFNATAKEFGVYPMNVKRLWDALTVEERERYTGKGRKMQEKLIEKIVQQDADLLQALHGKFKDALGKACDELNDRLSPEKIDGICNKDLINLTRLLYQISTGQSPDEASGGGRSGEDMFAFMDKSVKRGLRITINKEDDGTAK